MEPGAEETFEQFYRQHEHRVRRLLMGMLGERTLAADAAQETWMRFLRYVNRPDPQFEVALLVTVARSVARDLWRRRRREEPTDRVSERADPSGLEDAVVMADLVARLPYGEREVVVMHYALDRPLWELAKALGETESAVKSRLHRARERLRAQFLSEEGEHRGAR